MTDRIWTNGEIEVNYTTQTVRMLKTPGPSYTLLELARWIRESDDVEDGVEDRED